MIEHRRCRCSCFSRAGLTSVAWTKKFGSYSAKRGTGTSAAAAVQHNARTHSGPPSTRATVTMDGGVADTAHANTPVLTQAVTHVLMTAPCRRQLRRAGALVVRITCQELRSHIRMCRLRILVFTANVYNSTLYIVRLLYTFGRTRQTLSCGRGACVGRVSVLYLCDLFASNRSLALGSRREGEWQTLGTAHHARSPTREARPAYCATGTGRAPGPARSAR